MSGLVFFLVIPRLWLEMFKIIQRSIHDEIFFLPTFSFIPGSLNGVDTSITRIRRCLASGN